MNYKELKTIADENILDKQKTLPADAFQIASKLNLRIKNSVEAKKDLGTNNNPLMSHNAVYVLYKGEYTIYYDEHYRYKNFSVAHEVAHHILGHTSDGADQHKDAQLMAAIIVAPIEEIIRQKIKSANELSEMAKIPIEVAKGYWNEIANNKAYKICLYQQRFKKIGLILGVILAITGAISVIASMDRSIISESSAIPIPTYTPVAIELDTLDTVYVTRYGSKYHKQSCRHIKTSEIIIEFPVDDAVKDGYLPCKDCMKEW